MRTTEIDGQPKNRDRIEGEALAVLIREQIIHSLGEPRDLLKVVVRPLWDKNYRVNVFTGKDAACARIANSFFVAMNADGQILSCNPKITKQYEGA